MSGAKIVAYYAHSRSASDLARRTLLLTFDYEPDGQIEVKTLSLLPEDRKQQQTHFDANQGLYSAEEDLARPTFKVTFQDRAVSFVLGMVMNDRLLSDLKDMQLKLTNERLWHFDPLQFVRGCRVKSARPV